MAVALALARRRCLYRLVPFAFAEATTTAAAQTLLQRCSSNGCSGSGCSCCPKRWFQRLSACIGSSTVAFATCQTEGAAPSLFSWQYYSKLCCHKSLVSASVAEASKVQGMKSYPC